MSENLSGTRVAILATNGFEQSELLEPRQALEAAGAETDIISLKEGMIRAWKHKDWGDEAAVDLVLSEADEQDYDALLLPGGVMNPDTLRTEPVAVAFVKAFYEADKPIAAICHGPWMLVESGIARGHRLTSWPSLKTDIENAGAEWVDEEVMVDDLLVTSRKPDDIPAFNRAFIKLLGEKMASRLPEDATQA